MKEITLCVLLLLNWTARAQNFEGTIRWSMKTDIMDPAMKAKMADAQQLQQQKMNDPATQAKIQEMQARLNTPQMKAQMDANPQLKAQMENMIKSLQGGGGNMGSMMPKGYTVELKGQNILTKMDGGPMAMEMLYLKDKNQSYRLDRQNKTYSVMDMGHQDHGTSATPPKVTKTSETTKILDYNCTKYLVEHTEGPRTVTMSIWTTTEIKDIDSKNLAKQRMGRGQSLMYEGMEGIPLRFETSMAGGSMTMEVTDIKRENLDASEFTIPADFTETQGTGGKL